MKKFLCLLTLSLCFTTGCVDQKGTINQETKNDIKELIKEACAALPSPTINVPPNQKVDTEELKKEINASSNNTASQMTGALNLSVSKLTDQMKGVEANIGKLLEINNTLTATLNSKVEANATAIADFKLILQNTITLTSEVKASLQAITNIQNSMSADLKVMNSMSADLKTNANAIAGVGIKLENLNQNLAAGRDINYLPKEAVYMVGIFIGAMVLLAALVVFLLYKSSMKAMQLEADKHSNERKRVNQLLVRAMAVMPIGPDKDKSFAGDKDELKKLLDDMGGILGSK
jgi:hypothetical protein